MLRGSSQGCPQQVVRVGPIEFREKHDTRTNGQHYTLQQTASRTISYKLEMHGKAKRIARSAPQCRPLANTCEKHLLTTHLSA